MPSLAFAFSLVFTGAGAALAADGYIGAWDILILDPGSTFNSSWWKVEKVDGGLKGSMVWKWGSAVPVKSVQVTAEGIAIVQREGAGEMVCLGKLEGENLRGTVRYPDGKILPIEGRRAPEIPPREVKGWGEPVRLFDGKSLDGWKRRSPGKKPSWEAKDGVLTCRPEADNDLVTEKTFKDFKLHIEFNVDKGSNSGIYLRGRYEVQIVDDHGQPVDPHGNGSVYSRIAVRKNVSKPAGEWQTCDIVLVGREVTVVLNGEAVIEKGHLDGITGGAYPDPWEGNPGPLMLQGDHGKVSFRNILLTPPKD